MKHEKYGEQEKIVAELGLTAVSLMAEPGDSQRAIIYAFGIVWELTIKKVKPQETVLLSILGVALWNFANYIDFL